MPQFVRSQFSLDGEALGPFSHFTLSQSLMGHHTFQLTCPADTLDAPGQGLLVSSRQAVGARLTGLVQTKPAPGGGGGVPAAMLQFTGLVTGVEILRTGGPEGQLLITGHSPTILLENGEHCQSWEKQTLQQIAERVLQEFPRSLLSPLLQPAYREVLAYTVQYQESAWQFLCRLSAYYGEWFYFDGESLRLGPPPEKPIELIYGQELARFRLGLQLSPTQFEVTGYDYLNHVVYRSKPEDVAIKAGLNELGKHTLNKSQHFYTTKPNQFHNGFLQNKSQLDGRANQRAAGASSQMVQFQGESNHCGLLVGGVVIINGKNALNERVEGLGEYRVTSITHQVTGSGDYGNTFTAVPATIKVVPVDPFLTPSCGTQSAMVTDNHDPRGLGRVRVKFHWMRGGEKSPWLRVTSPHGGGGKGMFFIPEKGEEVVVGFEGEDAEKPFVLGTVFHGQAKSSLANAGNDVKALQTRSGNKMVMNDKDGSVFISDKGGANTMMNGAGNIVTTAASKSMINVGGEKDQPPHACFSMDSEGNIVIDGKKSIILKVGDNTVTINEEGIMVTASKGEVNVEAVEKGILLTGKTKVNVESTSEDVTLKAAKTTNVGGGKLTNVTGSQVEINQS